MLLVTVARLAEQKGLPTLLDAVAQLTDLPIRAVVAGDGPLRAGLESDIAGRALPVHLLGRRDDIADLLAAADVVVVPSLWEGQPLIVQEALAAGAAIVATDAGGTGEVAGDAAVLVPAQDPRGAGGRRPGADRGSAAARRAAGSGAAPRCRSAHRRRRAGTGDRRLPGSEG